jgi:hypothetical protein
VLASYNLKPNHYEKLYQSVSFSSHISELELVKPQKKKNNSEAYCELYAANILKDSTHNAKSKRFLEKHHIDSTLRARMLDWMVEVIGSYKFTDKTYFDGIQIMDRYF